MGVVVKFVSSGRASHVRQSSRSARVRRLRARLETETDPRIREAIVAKNWPKNARALSSHVTRLAPNLRKTGFVVEHDRLSDSKRTRIVRLKRNG
jgi:hypothetical protein